ncbi:MAG TPA: protein kinase [Candidatus Solibacter sp.]|nr:protein kinase [Candidatus Solibacter sp.]
MALDPGTRLGPYEIVALLGEGGMGAVYRATDTKLRRHVAIKVLPEAFAQDAARMQRFEREAQVLASLNHPNIAAIYGVESGAIVMELVEGEDLLGPVAIDTAIAYARQIAAGLEAAHEKGIVHRDLKPANIKVTPDGVVKILDFGLAKAGEESVSPAAASPTMLPTMSLGVTQAGSILGTAAYMAPEQARGKPVDKRADIWAFGVVLFEMLAGGSLFGASETASDAIAAILTKDPDWNKLPAATPPHLRRLIERCLRRDPKQRLRDIGDARLALEEPDPVAAPVVVPAGPKRAWLPWTIAAVGLLGAGVAWLRPKGPDTTAPVVRFQLALPPDTLEPSFPSTPQSSPSPDGQTIAFVAIDPKTGRGSLWVRPLNAGAAHKLDRTEGANFPFWSPDSQNIAFFADHSLKRISVNGGALSVICDVPSSGRSAAPGDGGNWSADGTILFGSVANEPLRAVPAAGGTPTPVTALEAGETWHGWPQFLPDGRHFLFHAVHRDEGGNTIWVGELGSKKRTRVLVNDTRGVFAPPGFLLYSRDGTLYVQTMNLRTYQLEGGTRALAQDVTLNENIGRSAFAVSQNGVITYRQGNFARAMRQLSWYDRHGKLVSTIGAQNRTQSVSISPDGKSAAVLIGLFDRRLDTWTVDLTSGVFTQVTRDAHQSEISPPAWSADSHGIAITTVTGEIREINLATGAVETLPAGNHFVEARSRDGRFLLVNDGDRKRLSELTPRSEPKVVLATDFVKQMFSFSPDGKYVTYASNEAGGLDVYVAAYPAFAPKRRVSPSGGLYPVWSPRGNEIFYRGGDGSLMAAEVRTSPDLSVGVPQALFKFGLGIGSNRFAVSSDGQRFLISEFGREQAGQISQTPFNVILNWPAIQ